MRPLSDWEGEVVRFRGCISEWRVKPNVTHYLLINVQVSRYDDEKEIRTLDHVWMVFNDLTPGQMTGLLGGTYDEMMGIVNSAPAVAKPIPGLERLKPYYGLGMVRRYKRGDLSEDFEIAHRLGVDADRAMGMIHRAYVDMDFARAKHWMDLFWQLLEDKRVLAPVDISIERCKAFVNRVKSLIDECASIQGARDARLEKKAKSRKRTRNRDLAIMRGVALEKKVV